MSLLLENIVERAISGPARAALSDGARTLTYGDLCRAVDDVARHLGELCAPGDAIAVCMDNSPAWVVLDLALIKAGCISVPIPLFFTDRQLNRALAHVGARALIADRARAGFSAYCCLTAADSDLGFYPCNERSVALPAGTTKVTYTSGSTGDPKGVCLSQIDLERVATSLVDAIGTKYAGVHCAVLPLAVLLENVAGLYPTLLAGGNYHVPPLANLGFGKAFVPDFAALVRGLAACKATSAIMVPELLRGSLAMMAASRTSLPEMKLLAVGGAKVAQALLARAERLGLPVYQGYGLSEMGSVVTLNTPAANRPGSIGRPLRHVDLAIAQDGEITIASPLFLGYVGGPASPSVLKTGDIARRDEDGYLHIEGRQSNVLVTGFGRNVSPEWVESELLSEPVIGQALVFGDGAPALGALIVPSALQVEDAALEEAVDAVNGRLPEYARVAHWAKVMPFTPASGELTANGRPLRDAIHQHHRELMAQALLAPGRHIGFFETLVAATRNERQTLQATPQIRDGLRGEITRATYLDYLTEAYHHVRHTVPLMRLARSRIGGDRAWLVDALDHYIEDETGHEEWILRDIQHTGGDPDRARQSTPRLATELMVAYAYDFVSRINPVGFFGMVFVLEGTSTQLATRGAEALMRSLKLPPDCFSYLLSHGAIDLEHMRFLQQLLDRIDGPEDRAAVVHMAKRIFVLFADVFRSIPHNPARAHAI